MTGRTACEGERRIAPRAQGDTPALLDLWVAAWRQTYDDIDFDARREWFAARLEELEAAGACTLCLSDRGALAGFVVIHPLTGWLDQLCVHPDHFGAGVAPALIAAARQASPSGVRLDVNEDNSRAVRFYEREGFVKIGVGPFSRSGRKTIVLEWEPGAKRSA